MANQYSNEAFCLRINDCDWPIQPANRNIMSSEGTGTVESDHRGVGIEGRLGAVWILLGEGIWTVRLATDRYSLSSCCISECWKYKHG